VIAPGGRRVKTPREPLAQLAEHRPFKPRVLGSTPRRLTFQAVGCTRDALGLPHANGDVVFPVQGVLMRRLALTAAEVAALVGLDEGRVRKEVEHGFLARTSPPRFSFADLVYFDAVAMLDVDLGVADRKKLHKLIASALAADRAPSRIEMGPVFEVR